jgi:hypothetical protein
MLFNPACEAENIYSTEPLKLVLLPRFLLLTVAFAAFGQARGEDYAFETAAVRLVLGSDGAAKSLVEKRSGREWLAPERLPFAAVKKGEKLFPATKLERRNGLLRAVFGESGVRADYRLTARPDYIVIELAGLEGCAGMTNSPCA